MKKILIVAPYGFNDRMTNFIEFASGRLLAREGFNVHALVGSDNGKDAEEETGGIKVHRYGRVSSGLRKMIFLLLSRPKVLHIHNLRNNRVGIAAAMLAKALFIPLAFTEYGLLHDHYLTDDREDPLTKPIHPERVITSIWKLLKAAAREPSRFKYYLSSYIFHWPLCHADRIVFVSKHNLRIAKELGLKGAILMPQLSDTERFDYKGTDETFSEREQEILSKLTLMSRKSVLFIGQMKLRKGWDILLKAIPHVPKESVEHFAIVTASYNEEHPEFKELIDSLNIRDRIVFLGKIFNSSLLKKAYEKSLIVAVPSRYEGFGLAPIEAFEMEKPVVASDVEALSDFLIHGENSYLVPPKDPEKLAKAITELAGDRELQEKLVAGGRATLERMRSRENARMWVEFYEKL